MTTLDLAKALQSDIVNWRRYLHANPELSFKEFSTQQFLLDEFAKLNYQTQKIAKTGIIAQLSPDPVFAIRADMDGLPICEETATNYSSVNSGVMHACGHDAHMSIALACARILKNENKNNVRFLMQPAEENSDDEGKSGAYRMIESGALNGIKAIIGLHVDSTIPAGQVSIAPGPIMAASDSFVLKIIGSGGHGAFPESTIDPVVIASHIITMIQQIISRKISTFDQGIVTIGSIESSSKAGNVISDYVELKGTIRTFKKDVRQKILNELENICAVSRNMGGDYQIKFEFGYPATVNDKNITEIMHKAASQIIGGENIIFCNPKTWSEDFSMYQEKIPGCFMFLGAKIIDSPRKHHHPKFDIDESGLYLGAAIMAQTIKLLDEELNK